MRALPFLGAPFILFAASVLSAGDDYVRGILVEIRGGEQYSGSSSGRIPGGTITIPWTSTKYELVVQVDDLLIVGSTGWDKKPKGFVANDPVRVRFSRDGEKMWVVSPRGKEYKTSVLSRHRLPRGAASATMTWVIHDSCGAGAQLKFYDKTRDLVWPSSTTNYVIPPRGTDRLALNCGVGDKICYGATQGRTYWGIGVDGNQGCEGCCHTCAETEVSFNLTCR